MGDDRIELATQWYEDAVFGGDADALPRADQVLDAVEADLLLARGKVAHARFLADHKENPDELRLFERSVSLYRALGDGRGEGEALFWIGCYHQVVRDDTDSAVPNLERSRELARRNDDRLTLSYAVRHLGFAELAAERTDAAKELFEESVRLREEIGFTRGVAAGKLALAELATETGERDEAIRLLDEAEALAASSEAAGLTRWIEASRAALGPVQ
jgi:tetratricopeptide (TPR) repeat protein